MRLTSDDELDERIRQTLADLSRLSEVGAAQVGRSSRSSEQDLPRGVSPSMKPSGDRPPDKDRSLFDWFAWHFGKAESDATRRVLLWMAESDLKARQYALPEGNIAGGAGSPTGEKRDARILSWYEGAHPLEAAMLESHHGGYCSEVNVREVRRRGRCDEETGRRLPGWRGWSDEERRKAYNRERLRGKGLDLMAQEFGIPKSTLQNWEKREKRQLKRAA